MNILKKIQIPKIPDLVRHVFLAWLLAAFLEYLLLPNGMKVLDRVDGLAVMSLGRMAIIIAVVTVALWLGNCFFPIAKYERYSIVAVFLLFAVFALVVSYSGGFLVFSAIILVIFIVYAMKGYQQESALPAGKGKAHPGFFWGTMAAGVVLFAVMCIWSVYRLLSFSCPDFDFGIFSQMFYNMKETGLPITTIEREVGALSHFKVHVSPIYYLMLPFYMLFPDAVTLQVLQAAVIASAVIPMWLIGKQQGLSGLLRLLLCLVLVLLPTTAGGISYDLHENCFLLPLVLWLMYAIDRRSIILSALFAFLTLMVKEDAAVYVAVAALYLIVKSLVPFKREKFKDLLLGIGMLIGALVWFKLVTDYLTNHGDGVMTTRYDNFIFGKSQSLISVIFAVIMNPMKMLYECVEKEKIEYILLTLLPLLGLPLLTRKYHRYILLIPYILVNLMSDYEYQHSVLFQYNFGSSAFLLYLIAVNLADLKQEIPKIVCAGASVVACLICFCIVIIPPIAGTVDSYYTYEDYYHSVQESLDLVPDDASVAAHAFYAVELSDREELYGIRLSDPKKVLDCDYIVLRSSSDGDFRRYGSKNGYESFVFRMKVNGYKLYHKNGTLEIYRKIAK